jgi:hypothetical protein
MDLNGIFPLVIGLLIIIFSKALDRGIYEFWKPIFPNHPFLRLVGRIVIVLGGILLITGGILTLIGLLEWAR